jgi:hypothetical protein
MKIRYGTEIIEGGDPDEIVTIMRETSRFGEDDNQAYMDGFARRQAEYDGFLPRTDSSLEFLRSLIQHGLMDEVKD